MNAAKQAAKTSSHIKHWQLYYCGGYVSVANEIERVSQPDGKQAIQDATARSVQQWHRANTSFIEQYTLTNLLLNIKLRNLRPGLSSRRPQGRMRLPGLSVCGPPRHNKLQLFFINFAYQSVTLPLRARTLSTDTPSLNV